MNGYVTLGTNDLSSAALFYEQLLESIGVKRQRETPRSVYFGTESGTELVVITPADGKSATAGLISETWTTINLYFLRAETNLRNWNRESSLP